ncbi:tRNA (guanosine(46)-N7)-methyltransferase TrmB [Halochromatium glycolicum]|uniref:tRNA (guanine-N(7)-)-methyltransferase n=1 Tax=Halochromatium glycolicum TaxID=85075 RepID=A0AAJ0U3F6_9GAMM|nr:tRNA (guanosine(46)-N7)-methyltransferase TrmB [Halochromatium glycolicum]MBK1704125.1 tRNA (guanosine(46)-N7)-methyltransferase TrmB [Halochromatium glycolicum]
MTKTLTLANPDLSDAAARSVRAAEAAEPSHPPNRPIRSFVLREGRLTAAQERAFRELWPRFGVDWQPNRVLDPCTLFGGAQPRTKAARPSAEHATTQAEARRPCARPITLEIGFGDGESLAAMAAAAPERDFIGLEVHRPGIGHLLLALERLGLDNVRVLRADASALLSTGLPAGCLETVQLFFPDPWPKKRHHKRRIVQPDFIAAVARALRPGGTFHLATDWPPYAEWMLAMLDGAPELFVNQAGPGRYAERPASRPITKFERRGQRLGHPVHDLLYRRR